MAPISFARLQEYLDLIVAKQGGNVSTAPHHRFWKDYDTLTTAAIPRPKCQGQPIFPVKFIDPARTQVDADNSPLFLILTNFNGFCDKEQMPPRGPFITAANYSLTLSDGTVVTGDQVKQDIHDWLAAGAPNDPVATGPALAARPDWSIAGKWTYRSYRNRADVLVNADAEDSVKALGAIYGQDQVETASAAIKSLSLMFGEGVMTFDPPSGSAITGTLEMRGGLMLDLAGTIRPLAGTDVSMLEIVGTGRPKTHTENWEYDYKAFTTPKWPNGVNQVPAFVGTVIRAKTHGTSLAGVVASFVSIKQ